MPSPRTIPSRGAKDVVTTTVRIDGGDIPKTFEVAGISVFKGIGRIPFARIEIYDGDPAGQSFAASGNALFTPGKQVEILAGYRSQEDVIFKGTLVGQKIRIRKTGRGLLTLLCRHALYQATLTRRSRTWKDKTDAECITANFQEYSIATQAAAGGITHPAVFQHDASDWDFALIRARAAGLFLIPTDAGVDLAKPDFTQAPALTLQFGATVLELDAEFDIRDQPAACEATAWDPSSQAILEASGDEPSLPAAGNFSATDAAAIHGQDLAIRHPGAIGEEELKEFATASLLFRRLAWIVGRVQCAGTPACLPGTLLKLEGAGDRFSGDLLVSAVRHTLSNGQWTSDIQFGIPKTGDEPASGAPAANMVPPTRGLHLGVVEAIESDPDGEFRIQVALPVLGEKTSPVFARLASFDAGEERGAAFFPEIGDEVVIAFLNDDPRHAVVLGSLFSSARAAPFSPADKNPEKGYYSRSKMKFTFNDETTELLLETPAGNSITLSEDKKSIEIKDQNGNKIVLDSAGITLESAKDLVFKAANDMNLSGVNVGAEASGQFTASGSAGAELSASGNTVVKGALVQIN